MPYESHDHEDLFLEHLDTLKAIIEDLNTTCISIVGDWNSDISDYESVNTLISSVMRIVGCLVSCYCLPIHLLI